MTRALRLVPMSETIPKKDRERWARMWVWTWTQIAHIHRREVAAYDAGYKTGRQKGYEQGNRIGRKQGASRIERGVTEKPCAICSETLEVENYWIDRCVMIGRNHIERLEMWRAYCAAIHGHPCPQETE